MLMQNDTEETSFLEQVTSLNQSTPNLSTMTPELLEQYDFLRDLQQFQTQIEE